MSTSGLDRVLMEYEREAQIHAPFEQRYGAVAASYLSHLPWLFRLFRRAPFDPSLPLRARHGAAVVAFYLAEDADFFGPHASVESVNDRLSGVALPKVEESDADAGLIDDVFAAYYGLDALVQIVGDANLLRPHWRSTVSFAVVLGLSKDLQPLRDQCPSKVLERVEELLRMPHSISSPP